jgi:hypothetical protein
LEQVMAKRGGQQSGAGRDVRQGEAAASGADSERPTLTREWKGDRTEEETPESATDHLYDPNRLTSTRMREQGLGMGQQELLMQRDATGATTTREERERTETTAQDESEGRVSDLDNPPKRDKRH